MELTPSDIDRIIQMAWEDRTAFDAIRAQFGLTPGEVIKLMRAVFFSDVARANNGQEDQARSATRLDVWSIPLPGSKMMDRHL